MSKVRQTWQRLFKPSSSLVTPHHDMAVLRRLRGRRWPQWRQWRHFSKLLDKSERRWYRVGQTSLVVGLALLVTAIVWHYRIPQPAVGGEYTEGIVGAPHLVNPIFAPLNETDMDLSRLVYSGLLRYDAVGNLVPDLTTEYQTSADRKTYTFTLRKGVMWHDGEPFTSRDVAFTIEVIQDPTVGSPLLSTFQGVKVSAIDDYTVQLSVNEVAPGLLSSLTVGMLPEHMWGGLPRDQIRLAPVNISHPIGTGPYMMKRLYKDDTGYVYRYTLTRFASYYAQPAYVTDLSFQFFSDYDGDQGAIQALLERKVDGLHFVPAAFRDRVQRKHTVLHTLQLPQYSAVFFNQDRNADLADKDVRVALNTALDKERILQQSVGGEGTVLTGPVLPGFPGYQFTTTTPVGSIDEANALLDKKWKRITVDEYKEALRKKFRAERQASETPVATTTPSTASSTTPTTNSLNDSEIEQLVEAELNESQLFYRQNKDGRILQVDVVTADTFEYRAAAQLIAGYWGDLGVRAVVSYVAPKDITRTALKDRVYDALLYGIIVGADPDQTPFWHSSEVDYPGLNLARYNNKKVDDLLTKIRQSTTVSSTADLSVQFNQIVHDDLPAIFLYTPTYTYLQGTNVQGFGVTRIAHPADRFANVTDWYTNTRGVWSR